MNFTRIDLALDDYDETVKFADIEKKLNKGHYRSSRKSYNIVKRPTQRGGRWGKPFILVMLGLKVEVVERLCSFL